MRDSALRLQDKNIVLTGPFGGITQAILRLLTEHGADVAYVGPFGPSVSKYTDAVNEAREVHPQYGRAVYLDMPLSTEQAVQDATAAVVGAIGRMDVLIDASALDAKSEIRTRQSAEQMLQLARVSIPFMQAKQRGRLIYLFEDSCLDGLRPGSAPNEWREMLQTMIAGVAKNHSAQNILVNSLSVGATEDFLLGLNPGSVSIKSTLEKIQKEHPGLRLVDANDVASNVAFLSGALCAGLTGETLRLTHGFHLVAKEPVREVRPSA